MSIMTHAVLITPEAGEMPMRELHAWCRKHASGQTFEPIYNPNDPSDKIRPGGRKVFCYGIFAVCGNYFPYEKLIEVFPSFGWGKKRLVGLTILTIRHEGEDEWYAMLGDGQPARVSGYGPPAKHCGSVACARPLFDGYGRPQNCACACEPCLYARASGVSRKVAP